MASLAQESTGHGAIEPDNASEQDRDSAYGEDLDQETTSITSSVLNYTYENGRRYSALTLTNTCLLPNDEDEQDRLDLLHHIFKMTLDGELCKTKLQHPQRILDVGTDTGIWAIEMGDEYPSADIIGTDISPIQPTWVPPNVRFEIHDASREWTFKKYSFDFIYVRALGGSLDDWPFFLKQCYEYLRPGGVLEVAEVRTWLWCGDDSFSKESYTNKWQGRRRLLVGFLAMLTLGQETFKGLCEKMGKPFDITPLLRNWLGDAGFTDYKEKACPLPIGRWPADKKLKEIGKYFQYQFLNGGMENYTLALFCRSGWQYAEVQALLGHVRREVTENKMHVYSYAVFATAQKPLNT